ncbi:thioredoxin [bacterium]|nr:thioredoxin [bacterium]
MAGSAVKVTGQDFESTVISSSKPVFVDFWATWCPPCKRIAPFVEELAKDYEGKAVVAKIDVDEAVDVASRYGINSVPTLMVFKNGQPVEAVVGALPKEQMARLIDKHL